MTAEKGKTLVASRLVHEDPAGKLRIRFDLGVWTIESEPKKGPIQRLEVDLQAMDRLVEAWPRLRESAMRA